MIAPFTLQKESKWSYHAYIHSFIPLHHFYLQKSYYEGLMHLLISFDGSYFISDYS